jgi:hypothetical protein
MNPMESGASRKALEAGPDSAPSLRRIAQVAAGSRRSLLRLAAEAPA